MELQHFSHDHPLVFTDEVRKEEGGDEVVCYGCNKSLSGSAYSCEKCNYFLHKKCAELPLTLDHPMHEEHLLTLFSGSPYSKGSAICNVCRDLGRTRFTYHCGKCSFDVDILCVLEKGTLDHEGHHHTLTLLVKKASFNCHVCGTEGSEQSYLCMKCQFWIHKSCAFSPPTMMRDDHADHPLVLGYSLPDEFRSFEFTCDICGKLMQISQWLYYCNKCRYFLHMKCAISGRKSIDEGKIIADDPDTVIRFPLSTEALRNLLSQTLNKVSLVDNEIRSKIDHLAHNHSLVLFDEQSASSAYEDLVCDGCIQPISLSSYYGCTDCGYFLHKSCTKLPNMDQFPCHYHKLKLGYPTSFAHGFHCIACRKRGNGFYYSCETCDQFFHIGCAFFPKLIKHESHKHTLQIDTNWWFNWVYDVKCEASNQDYGRGSALACEACDYYISIRYAECPPTFEHDWEGQPLMLSYPPYSDHPYRLYCEVCEEEMYPKSWSYRSCDGRLFFHMDCVVPDAEYSKTKFGHTLKIENHPHPLTYVRKSKNKFSSLCDRCGGDFKGEPVIECAPCKFLYCTKCCGEISISMQGI